MKSNRFFGHELNKLFYLEGDDLLDNKEIYILYENATIDNLQGSEVVDLGGEPFTEEEIKELGLF